MGKTALALSDDEIARYREDGIVVPRFRLPAATLRAMRDALDRLLAAHAERPSDSLFNPQVSRFAGDPIAAEWLEFARLPAVIDMVAQLVGPDVILWGTTVFGKPAGTGKRVPWHQDGEYWPIRPLATCSVWMALDEATAENGCLRVIPGSHRARRLLAHHRDDGHHLALNQVLDPTEYREAHGRDVVLEAGQLSLHDVYLVHGSEPNRSSRRRAGFVCRYMPASSVFDRALGREIEERVGLTNFSTRPIWLVRGRDVSGRNDFTIGH